MFNNSSPFQIPNRGAKPILTRGVRLTEIEAMVCRHCLLHYVDELMFEYQYNYSEAPVTLQQARRLLVEKLGSSYERINRFAPKVLK